MKGIFFAIIVGSAVVATAADLLPKEYKSMTQGRRVCVRRDTETLKGYVIAYYERDGKPDWKAPAVTTNAVRKIKGAKQNNAIENARQAAEVEAAPAKAIKAAAKKAAKKDAKIFDKAIKNLEKARDASASEEFKNFYQRTIDLWMSEIN